MYQCGSVYVCVDKHVCVCVCMVCVYMQLCVLIVNVFIVYYLLCTQCGLFCVYLPSGIFSGRPADYLFMLIFCGVIIIVSLTMKTSQMQS